MEIEGIVKFKFKSIIKMASVDFKKISNLNKWRNILYKHNCIGYDRMQKVGFGNLSVKSNHLNNFFITGSQTGDIKKLSGKHYTEVTDYSIKHQWLSYKGPIKASSESLTHAALYETNKNIKYIFHIHHHVLWKYLLENNCPQTSQNVNYGTLQMAQEVSDLVKSQSGLIVMKGHQDGIISYGDSSFQAGSNIINLL